MPSLRGLVVAPVLLAALVAPGARSAASAAVPGSSTGSWQWPVSAPVVVTRGFEPPDGRFGAGHRGVDLAAVVGSSVGAAGAGTVVLAERIAGVPVVVIAHGAGRSPTELRTTYEPVVASVGVGASVEAGEPIGALGRWPGHCRVTGACLHWGLRRGPDYLDPRSLLDGPVRLLPVPVAPAIASEVTGAAPADPPVAGAGGARAALAAAGRLTRLTRVHGGGPGPRGSSP